MLFVVSAINAETGFARTTAAEHYGWLVPVVAGFTVAGVAWALLTSRSAPDDVTHIVSRCECEECGGTVLGDWRLCPHCGYRFPDNKKAS